MNQYDYKRKYPQGQFEKKSLLPSLTMPNMALPLKEIVQRFSLGQELPIAHNVYYDEELHHDAIDPTLDPSFDLVDMSTMQGEISARLAKQKADEEAERERERSERQRQADEERVAKILAEKTVLQHKTDKSGEPHKGD